MTSTLPPPPAWIRRILARRLGSSVVARSILAELDDEFGERAATNITAARRWYRREAPGVWWRARRITRLHTGGAGPASAGDPLMRILLADIGRSTRSLVKQPRFTVIASLTLALGVGAVTAIFSIVNGVLLKPLPFPEADRVVNVWSHAPTLGYDEFPLSPDLFFHYEKEARSFKSMAMYQARRANLTGEGAPDVVNTRLTTFTYFDTLGVPVVRGRSYSAAEDGPGGSRVLVLSHRAWQNRFGSDPNMIGRALRLNGEPYEVVGIADAAVDDTRSADIYLPTRMDRAAPTQGNFGWNAIGRLKAGVTPADASKELSELVPRFAEGRTSPQYRAFLGGGGYSARVNLMFEDIVGDLERPLWILLGTVGLLLVMACANVANLFLVRAEGRQLEIAVRVALGGSRWALVRAMMVEALVLASAGSALGVAAAAVGLPALLRLAPPTIPRLDQVTLDVPVLLFAVAVAIGSALLFGLLPALRYSRPASLTALRQSSRGGTEDPGRRRARYALIVAQTAIAMVLLVGSGLLARSFSRLAATNPGFVADDVMTFRVALPAPKYADAGLRAAFIDRLLARLGAMPGLERVGAVTELPIAVSSPGTAHDFDGRPTPVGALPAIVHYKAVAGQYFEAMRIPLARGRDFNSGDNVATVRNLIVNQALADHYWPGEDPLGKRVRQAANGADSPPPWFTVVGVVGNELQDGLREAPRPLLYYARRQPGSDDPPNLLMYTVRGASLTTRGEELRQAVWAEDPDLPVASMQPMETIVSASIVEFTFTMLTLAIAASMALLLGAIGLYGVLSYAVTMRTREIGVRLALGATPGVVMRSVVRDGTILAGIGLVIGLAGAAGLTRFMRGLLFETEPLDPLTFVAMPAALFVVAFLASYLPARRAAHVNPLESMKAD